MLHPFQCVATIQPPDGRPNTPGYLLAACGPELISVCLASGAILCQWSSADLADVTSFNTVDEDEERPSKKQKTAFAGPDSAPLKNLIKLTVSLDQQFVVAVTDDKCVRVFSFDSNGQLVELSSRCMPKRPCAIQVLPDNATLLCGDKFGDVYSLPLLPEAQTGDEGKTISNATTNLEGKKLDSKPFKPSATDKTVHTQRNLKSLAAQQNQKNLTPKTKQPLKFEHKLLLGHVSMLTDLAYIERDLDGKRRCYLITADRDEHIRVSRAPPQSHVIEGYCLGHKEFVSKVYPVLGTDLLVSGGGDDWVGVWEWPEFKLRRKLSLRHDINKQAPIAVCGIWVVPTEGGDYVLVACEKSHVLRFIAVEELRQDSKAMELSFIKSFDFPILDVACTGNTVIVSLDAREKGQKRLQMLQWDSQASLISGRQLGNVNAIAGYEVDEKRLDDLLYGIENLRKRGHQEEIEKD